MTSPISAEPAPVRSYLYYRHTLPVRIMHWTNVVALTILFMSGLGIFNAHPNLYWGKSSYTGNAPFVQIGSRQDEAGKLVGFARILGHEFETTGVLGVWRASDGSLERRAFPGWLTIPSVYWLSMARDWHFLAAWVFVLNGIAYVLYSLFSGHLRRDLRPTGTELRGIGRPILDHLRFRHPHGEAAKRYNILQKLAYLGVIVVLLPTMIMTGLTMSPGFNAAAPVLLDLFGGRQSARTIHFIAASLIVGFILVHLLMVVLAGPINEIRSMITGRYEIKPDPAPKAKVEAAP